MKSEAERMVLGQNGMLIFFASMGDEMGPRWGPKIVEIYCKKLGFGNMRVQERGPKTHAHSYHMHLEIYIKIISFLQKM